MNYYQAQLLQLLGDASQAWTLTSFASRVMVALGYHNLTSQALAENEHSVEIRHCLYYCYYLDKALSMLLVRPPSLPDLNVEPASLIELKPTEPLKIKMGILLKLSRVQDGVLLLLIKGDKLTEAEASTTIPVLKLELQDIRKESCEVRVHRNRGDFNPDFPLLLCLWHQRFAYLLSLLLPIVSHFVTLHPYLDQRIQSRSFSSRTAHAHRPHHRI